MTVELTIENFHQSTPTECKIPTPANGIFVIHTQIYIYTYVHICIFVYVCIYIYTYMHMCVCICICIHVCLYMNIYIYKYICICTHMYVSMYVYVCMYRIRVLELDLESQPWRVILCVNVWYMYVYKYIYVCTYCTNVCIYVYFIYVYERICIQSEHFNWIRNPNPSKQKQFKKGIAELREEGAVQVCWRLW